MKQPVFEILYENNHYKVYDDGKLEGFPAEGVIINRIPVRVAEKVAHWCDLITSGSPTNNAKSFICGCSQGTPE